MSGGSFDYMYSKIRDTYKGELHDQELEELLEDFCEVLKELEWWQSCDTSEERYAKWGRYVKEDICEWDEYGCGLEGNGDWDGVDAWMPKPAPYDPEGGKA